MSARRELQLAVLLCLLGSGLVLFAASRSWVSFDDPQAPTIVGARAQLSGAVVSPGAHALGYVGLAGVVALAATRRRGRIAVGVLVLLAGAGIAIAAVQVLTSTAMTLAVEASPEGSAFLNLAASSWWPAVACLGAALLVVSGLLVAVRGSRWAALSGAYETPAARQQEALTDKGVWEALDRGEDPTA